MTVVGVDVGGTKTLIALVTADGSILELEEHPTKCDADDVERVTVLTAHALERWREHDIQAVAVGFPEYVSAGAMSSREELSWSRQPGELLREANERLGQPAMPVVIESDVRLGALGEARFGAGRGLASFVYLSLGTGLSSTLVIDGRCWAGERGEAIAIGEWNVVDRSITGTLEAYASGSGIAARYLSQFAHPRSTKEIVALARAGDASAEALLRSAGAELGRACAAIVQVFDPAALIIGGGLGTADSPVTDALRQQYERSLHRPSPPPILIAELGPQAGVLGAAAAALAAASASAPAAAPATGQRHSG